MQTLFQTLAPFAVDLAKLIAWLAVLLAIFVPLERVFAVRPQKTFRKSFGIDLAFYFLSSLLPKLVLIVPLSLLARYLHRMETEDFYLWTADLPVWVRLTAAMVVGEIGAYWGHRWSHELPFLWRFHAVHHSAEELDWLVHTRAHPVDMVFTRLCGMVPIYLLGLAQPASDHLDPVPAMLAILATIWGFFIHANVKWRLGWFEWLIASPAFHHWHHTNDGPEVLNKNYAPMLPWVDRVFGTLYLPKKTWPGKYGIAEELPDGMMGQLLDPVIRLGTGER